MDEIRRFYDIIKPYAHLILIALAILMFMFLPPGGIYEDEGNGWQFVFSDDGPWYQRIACGMMIMATIGSIAFQFIKIPDMPIPLSLLLFGIVFIASFFFAVTMDSDEDMGIGALMTIILSAIATFLSLVQFLCERPAGPASSGRTLPPA